MLLNDNDIRNLCRPPSWPLNPDVDWERDCAMIYPFSEGVQGNKVVSYGLSHAGYDLRLGNELLIFKNSWNETVDPKQFNDANYRHRVFDTVTPKIQGAIKAAYPGDKEAELEQRYYIIPPHSYALGASLEYLRIPTHIKGRCVGKSTYARCGILINTTPLEPGWEGHLTIEISNISPCPAMIYAGEGIAQLEFELLTSPPKQDYAGKAGKYNKQGSSPVPARVKE